MGLFDRTLGSMRGQKAAVAVATVVPAGQAAFPNLRYESFVREGYQKNELVFAIVEEWATDIAEAQLKVWRDDADGKPAEVVNHAAVDLMNEPNPFMSGDDYLGAIEMYKRIAGNAYELKTRSGSTKVVQKWLLRPDRVTIVPDRQKYIGRYEYRIGAEKFDLDPADVIHHRTRNPYDDYYGMPTFTPATGRIDIDNYMRDMVKGFLQNSGMPAGILQVAGKLSDQEKQLVRMRFRNDFGGSNSGNIAISDGGSDAPKFTPLSMPLGARGLVVPELDEMDEARIIMVGRVPMSLIGARLSQVHSTLGQAGREADLTFFSQQQLVPEWNSIASTLTMGHRDDLLAPGEYFAFDLNSVRALTENQDALHMRVRQNVNGLVLSIQEARQELGYGDPKPDDVFNVPINVVPTAWKDIIAPPEPVVQPVKVPPTNPDQLPVPVPKKQLGAGPQVVVINAQPGEVTKLLEYDEDDRVIKVIERTGDGG